MGQAFELLMFTSQQHLERQLRFLRGSCREVDSGYHDESIRIAVSLRVLFHHTHKSHSLISQLGVADSLTITSSIEAIPDKPGLAFAWSGLLLSTGELTPAFEDSGYREEVPWEVWWNDVVLVQNGRITRKQIVLAASNKDGGAHVDPDPGEVLESLRVGIGTLNGEPLDNVHFRLLRQFAFEVLRSPGLLNATGA